VPSSPIGCVLESMPGSELENVLRGVIGSVLGIYLEPSQRLPGSILRAYLGGYSKAGWECHRVQLEVYLGAYLECTWECHESILRSI